MFKLAHRTFTKSLWGKFCTKYHPINILFTLSIID